MEKDQRILLNLHVLQSNPFESVNTPALLIRGVFEGSLTEVN